MDDLTVFFKWFRGGEADVEWVKTRAAFSEDPQDQLQQLWLVVDPDEPGESYRPLQELALFRTFADTGLTKEDVADFYRRYGLLCGAPLLERKGRSKSPQYGEPLAAHGE